MDPGLRRGDDSNKKPVDTNRRAFFVGAQFIAPDVLEDRDRRDKSRPYGAATFTDPILSDVNSLLPLGEPVIEKT